MIRRPPRSTPFPTRRSSDLQQGATYKSRTLTGHIIRKRPEVQIAAEAWRRVKGMLVEFGLTPAARSRLEVERDRKSTRLNSSHQIISYAVFCLKKKNTITEH